MNQPRTKPAGPDIRATETKWQKRWESARCFEISPGKPTKKFLNFDSAPFPNGPLHLGHLRNYVLGDIIARFKRLQGFHVLYTTNFDAFGLPNELAAKASGVSPGKYVESNIALITTELRQLGISYDWRHTKTTSDPEYYKWTQWIFQEFHAAGLIYRKSVELPWCPSCKTTLAFMQIKEGRCWRCDEETVMRSTPQWFVRISDYSDRLYRSLPQLDGWSTRVINLVRGFLGQAEGYLCTATIVTSSSGIDMEIFLPENRAAEMPTHVTTCANHPSVIAAIDLCGGENGVVSKEEYLAGVERLRRVEKQTPVPRMMRHVRGQLFNTGLTVNVTTCTSESLSLPLQLATGLSMDYGSPATFRFAPVDERLRNNSTPEPGASTVADNSARITVESCPWYKQVSFYQIHDWPVSRQRTWGTPIPFVHCRKCGEVPFPAEYLPVLTESHRDSGSKQTPNNQKPNVYPGEIPCFHCGTPAIQDPDTLDCYFDDMWCFLSPVVDLNKGIPGISTQRAAWLPVDAYHGGFDVHRYLHFARFFSHVMHERGYIDTPELIASHHGHDMVLQEGRKMSKHHGNAESIRPLLDQFGADVLRLAIVTAAAPGKPIRWGQSHIKRAQALLRKITDVLTLCTRKEQAGDSDKQVLEKLNRAKLSEDLDNVLRDMQRYYDEYRPHAAVQSGMRMVDRLHVEYNCPASGAKLGVHDCKLISDCLSSLALAFSPVIPHFCEELWANLGRSGLVADMWWPQKTDS